MPKVKCPNCHGEYEVHESIIGQRVECPDCKTEFVAKAARKYAPPAASVAPAETEKSPGFGSKLWKGVCSVIITLIVIACFAGMIGTSNIGALGVTVVLLFILDKLKKIQKSLEK